MTHTLPGRLAVRWRATGLICLAALGAAPAPAAADAARQAAPAGYPDRTLTIIVPNAAGSATDTLARLVAEELNRAWEQPVIVDNKPGAQGLIGVQAMKKAPADGYHLVISFSGLNSSNPWLQKTPSYHYRDDFTHIVPLVRAPSLLLVHADSPYRTLADLVEAARADPAAMTYGYGQATSQVMGGAFAKTAGFPAAVGIPYRGQPQALIDLVGRQYTYLFADLSVSKPFVDSGKLRALGISTQDRSVLMPGVPTLAEQGIADFDLAAWVGVSAPAGIPAGIADALNAQIRQAFRTQAVQERIRQLGFTPLDAGRAEFQAFVDKEYARWGEAIRAAGIEPQ